MTPRQHIALIALFAVACGSLPAPAPDVPLKAKTFTIPGVKNPMTLVVQEDGSCIDALVVNNRSCTPDAPDIDRDLRLHAKGPLEDQGYGVKAGEIAVRFSDGCSQYLCSIDRVCTSKLEEQQVFFFHTCIDWNACCTLAAEQ
jgi:hypothetical protein